MSHRSYESIPIAISSKLPVPSKCSTLQATNNLVKVVLGAGAFYLPYTCTLMGWTAVVPIAVFGSICIYSFSLIASCIELVLERGVLQNVTFADIGDAAFGYMGGNLCLASLATEFSLASVSLLINIGVNINTVFPAISIIQGIFISSVVSVLLVNIEDLKSFSYISSFGNSFILLSMAVMVISGTQFQMSEEISAHAYKYFDASGIPLSLGLIVFCYGGIGAFPKIYLSLEKREDHTNLLWLSGVIIIGVYCMVSVTGYGLFCSYTEMPITKNFGYNSHKIDLPFGVVERCLAALGIAFNMQITIPLILFTLKDLVMGISSGAAASRRSLISFLLCLGCMLAAMGLHSNFASLCSLVGSFCTSLNSVCLPVVFYHKLHKGNVSATRTAIHAMMLAFVITASALGITSSFCRIFTMTAGICSYV